MKPQVLKEELVATTPVEESPLEATEEEARRLFRAIFRTEPPLLFCQWFTKVPESVFPPFTPGMWKSYRRVLSRGPDLEALELASRLTGRNRILVYKFRLVIYLAECCPELRDYFINRRDLPTIVAWGTLATAKLHTLWKLVKGLALLVHYPGP